jgi:glycosyltransferase involved in cell wall biosynthesis
VTPGPRSRRPRLCVVVSHPIQYQAPLFRILAKSDALSLLVCFLSTHGTGGDTFDREFGAPVDFGVPLLSGYRHAFVPNRAPRPGVERALGLINPGLYKTIRSAAVDVVLVHGWAHVSEWLAFTLASLRGVPYMLRGEARPPSDAHPDRLAKRALLRPLVRHAAACLPIGSLNRQFYLSYGASSSRLFDAPYSVDNAWFAAHGDRGRATKPERLLALGLDPARPVIVFAAKLQPWKRPLDLALAFDRMRIPASLVFVGDGPLRSRLQAHTRHRSDVRLLGFLDQTEIGAWYGIADLVVLPSELEPWGLAVNEAMAAGAVPVVTEAVGCGPDLVTPETGRIVPTGDVDHLAQTLDDLLGSPTLLASLRNNARRRIGEFDLSETAAGIEAATTAAYRQRR